MNPTLAGSCLNVSIPRMKEYTIRCVIRANGKTKTFTCEDREHAIATLIHCKDIDLAIVKIRFGGKDVVPVHHQEMMKLANQQDKVSPELKKAMFATLELRENTLMAGDAMRARRSPATGVKNPSRI